MLRYGEKVEDVHIALDCGQGGEESDVPRPLDMMDNAPNNCCLDIKSLGVAKRMII